MHRRDVSYNILGVTAQATETLPALWSVASSARSLPDDADITVVSLIPAQIKQDQKDNAHTGPVLQCKLSGVSTLTGKIWETAETAHRIKQHKTKKLVSYDKQESAITM